MSDIMSERIGPERLSAVRKVVFTARSGVTMAERLGVKHTTLWAWLNREYGLPVERADQIARVLTTWRNDMNEAIDALQAITRERDEAQMEVNVGV